MQAGVQTAVAKSGKGAVQCRVQCATGNVCSVRFGTMRFKLWEPAVPYDDSCLASKTKVLMSGKRQFLAMVTSGSQVGNRKFQRLGTGSSLP